MDETTTVKPGTKQVGALLAGSLCLFLSVQGFSAIMRRLDAPSSPQPGAHQAEKHVALSASWAVGYQSIAELRRDADLVVLGSITGIAGVENDSNGLPFTDFTFRIERVISDPKARRGLSSITLHQTGGVMNGYRYEVEDDTLFSIGERAILFLREYSPGKYHVIGGPTGRFRSSGGRVAPIVTTGVRFTSPMTEGEFISLVEKTNVPGR